jgi:hypothetical protein
MREKTKNLHLFKICPRCDFFCNVNEPDNYCSFCGTKLIETCPNCGKPIENPYANFCKYCGEVYPGRDKDKLRKKEN